MKKLEEGDIIDLQGYSFLSTENYVRAIKIKHRPQERHSRLFLFSIAGLVFLFLVTIKDREKIREVLPLG